MQEEVASRGCQFSDKFICPNHVDDVVLKERITENLFSSSCSFCERGGTEDRPVAAAFDDFMDAFMVGVRNRFARAVDDAVPFSDGEFVVSTSHSHDVADEIFQEHAIRDYPDDSALAVLEEIQSVLLDDAWVRHGWQWPSDTERLRFSWDAFKQLVKHQSRFLFMNRPRRGTDQPDELSPVEFFEELADLLANEPGVCSTLTANTPLYRARTFECAQDLSELPVTEVFPPPATLCRSSNRMSPAGISMFYGASDAGTALLEVSAHNTEQHAVVGEFRMARDILVIDMTALPELPSIFEEDSAPRYDTVMFLKRFAEDLALPIQLDGREHIEYVPTQVFTEYLRYAFPGDPPDGMVFSSARAVGINYVLFGGPEIVAVQGNHRAEHMITIDPALLTAYHLGWQPDFGA
jgi:hypothetical protein